MSGNTTWFGVQYPSSSDYVKDGAIAIQTVADGFDSAVAIPTYNAQTGSTYTFVLADTSKTVTASNAAASTYTIPPQSSVVWVASTTLNVTNLGAGVVTFAGGAGVTVTNTGQTLSQYQSAQLIRTGSNAWTVTPTSGFPGGMSLIKSQTIGTTVASVTVTDAFSATYDAYKVILSGGLSSVSDVVLRFQLGASTTEYYFSTTGTTFAGGANTGSQNNATHWAFGYGRGSNGLAADLELVNPYLAKYTFANGSRSSSSVGNLTVGYHGVATSYADFTITPTTGTLTGGIIRVYGYNN